MTVKTESTVKEETGRIQKIRKGYGITRGGEPSSGRGQWENKNLRFGKRGNWPRGERKPLFSGSRSQIISGDNSIVWEGIYRFTAHWDPFIQRGGIQYKRIRDPTFWKKKIAIHMAIGSLRDYKYRLSTILRTSAYNQSYARRVKQRHVRMLCPSIAS